jgi:hypothetical protein
MGQAETLWSALAVTRAIAALIVRLNTRGFYRVLWSASREFCLQYHSPGHP